LFSSHKPTNIQVIPKTPNTHTYTLTHLHIQLSCAALSHCTVFTPMALISSSKDTHTHTCTQIDT